MAHIDKDIDSTWYIKWSKMTVDELWEEVAFIENRITLLPSESTTVINNLQNIKVKLLKYIENDKNIQII